MIREFIIKLVIFGSLSSAAYAQTVTPNLGLTLPAQSQPNWGVILNADFTLIDTFAGNTGTVKTISTGSLSPLFTAAIASSTTTPVLSFTLSTAGPHTFFGNNTGSTAIPSYVQPAFTDISGTVASAQMPAFSGDASSSSGSTLLTLATVNSNIGACGDATHIPRVVLDGKGRTTACTPLAISVGSGTVTSIGMSVPSWLTVAGSPITTSGTFAVTATGGQTANTFLATPDGSSGTVGLRAIAASDLPLATTSFIGGVRCDGSTITCTSGVISTVTHGTITGSGTNGFLALFDLSSTAIGNSHLDDGISNVGYITDSEAFQAVGILSTNVLGTINSTAATNIANQNSNSFLIAGNYWTGSASATDQWFLTNVLGVGSNPSSTLTLTHNGSATSPTISMPYAISTLPITISTSAGIGGGINMTEGTAAAGGSGIDSIYASSTTHRPMMKNNAGTVLTVAGMLTGTTGTITGTALSATCDSGTATVTGAVVGSPVAVGTTDGTDIGGAFYVRASVTSTNTVTVFVCGTGTPASKQFSVSVIQ